MPTYQYRCPTCNHEFEAFQGINEDAIKVCPKCHGETRRVISGGAGLIFKGTGFYITDYKKSGDKSTGSSSPKPPKSAGSTDSGNGGSEKKADSSPKPTTTPPKE